MNGSSNINPLISPMSKLFNKSKILVSSINSDLGNFVFVISV